MKRQVRIHEPKSQSGKKLGSLLVLLLAAAVLVMVAIPVLGLWQAFNQEMPSIETVHKLNTRPVSIPDDELNGIPYALKADMVVSQLDPVNATIDLLLHLEGDVLIKDIFVQKDNQRLFDETGEIREQYQRYQNLQAQLRIETPLSQDVIQSVPLRRLNDFSTVVQLPLDGRPNRYPQDWYDGSATVTVVLPNSLRFTPIIIRHGNPELLAVKLSLRTSNDTDLEVSYKLNHTLNITRPNSPEIQELHLLIRRDLLTRGFVWTMALIPLLLIFVAFTQISQSWRQEPTDLRAGRLISLEAVALLAILPLRQVLVPPEVRGLTTIDFLLGAELAAFIGLVAAQYILAHYRTAVASSKEGKEEPSAQPRRRVARRQGE